MKLAYFSPLNPQPSGISDYSEELLPYLAQHCEVDLFVDGFRPSNSAVSEAFTCFDYQKHPATLDALKNYDAIVYHLGNDHRYHAGIMEVARRYPGIIVFHDFALQDFFLGLAQERLDPSIYLEEVFACHGERATREAAESLLRGVVPSHVSRPLDFPLNCRLARTAEGIVVHSEWARARFAELALAVPAAHINMPIKVRPERPSSGNAKTVQIANFGLITPGKGIEQALRALATLKDDHDFHYTLVGAPNSFFDVRSLISKFGMDDRVTLTGHLSLDEFERYIDATDIALNLRERTVGETSASLCRIMAAGVPAIVFNVGAFSELPGDAVVKIDHDARADAMIEAYLRRLIEDANLRREIGANARRHILVEHDVENVAERYALFIREVMARRTTQQLNHSVATELSALGVQAADEEMLRSVAEEVAVLTPGSNFAAASSSASQIPDRVSKIAATPNAAGNRHFKIKESDEDATAVGRLPKIAGIDYKRAALEYPEMLDAERSYYLRTKPFYNLANKPDKHLGDGMDEETHRHFTDFANMARTLALPAGARILDVGCGSGWLSEYFARLGYDVTGIDISDDLIEMARERVRRVPYDVDHETPLRCRFITNDIETKPLDEKFDAVICYDSLHHFEDERAVFRHLASMLDVGGLLFVLEGHKPPSGSATEEELRGVMQHYGTLESPFAGDYLRSLLDEHGLAVVGDYVSVNGLFERELLEDDRLPLRMLDTQYHYLTSIKVASDRSASSVPDSRNPRILLAELRLVEPAPHRAAAGARLILPIRIKNSGDTLWLNGQTVRTGIVMPGVKVMNEQGDVIIEVHGQPMLPRAVAPGQQMNLDVACPVPAIPGKYSVKIDLVDQHICWFEERGTQPIVFNIEVVEKAAGVNPPSRP